MKNHLPRQRLLLALVLLLPSAGAYLLHWTIFRNAHDIFFYLLMDVAFLFVQAVLATLVFDQLLNAHERQVIHKKVNVMMGIFFSQVGTPLLRLLAAFNSHGEELRQHLLLEGAWSASQLQTVLKTHKTKIEAGRGDIAALKIFLVEQRDFLVRLLENPNLLEHETMTELLWAVFHLADELEHRSNVASLSDPDRGHLEGDILRAYDLLVAGWLQHMQHLKSDYPYLFSLARRTNPFDPQARVEIS